MVAAPEPLEASEHPTVKEIRKSLERLERRDWWLWCSAVVVMLALTLAVASFTVPVLLRQHDLFYQFHLDQAVRGLVGLVLLFSTYVIYQQLLIHRLRRQLSAQIGVMVRLQTQAEEFHKLATRDDLTGLYNRRFVEQRLIEEVNRSHRYGYPLALLLLDLNEFKHINDRYGHPAGDLVLKSFAQRLREAIRVTDLPARFGGDEFMVLLPDCPSEEVPKLLRRFRFCEVDFQGNHIQVTFAAGWAGYEKGEGYQQLIERADQALYANKRAGKNLAPAASLPG